jgi:tetratricopeptide (TPR) repeat protein
MTVAKKKFHHRERIPARKSTDGIVSAGVRRQNFAVCVCLVLLVAAVFGQTARFAFINYDDSENVYDNPVVQNGLSLKGIVWAFTHAQVSNWIPITTLSHMADCQLFGLNAGGHHLVNVLLHAATAVLLFLVLRQMTGALWRSAFVAVVFAIHPLRAESVVWVSERKDVLSAFFFVLAIGAYVRNVRRLSRPGHVVVLFLFAMGLMAKSMVATLPFVLLLLDYWPLGRLQNSRQFLRLVAEKIPLFALSAGFCVATAFMPGLIGNPDRLPLFERIGNALVACVVYLRQMVFPAGLAIPYPNPANGLPTWKVALAFVLLAVISVVVFAWRKKQPFLLAGWLWYLGMLVPVSGIVPLSSYAAHADRYTYLPGIGLAIAGTWLLADWSAGWKLRRLVLGGLMAAVVGTLVVCARTQTSYWRNSETLWNRALASTPANFFACDSLGNALVKTGRLKEAIAQFRMALSFAPDYVQARDNLAGALFLNGDIEEAIAQYRKVLEINPHYVEAYNNLGNVLDAKGRADEAIALYGKALAIKPDYVEARYDLGLALFKQGELDEAIAQYRKTLEINPDYVNARNNLGIALFQKGEMDEAIAQCRKVLAFKPDYAEARNNLGLVLVNAGKTDEAIAQYRKALAIKPDYADARYNLGNVLAAKGDADEAIAQYRQTLEINPDYAKARKQLGMTLLRKGDFDGAMACFEKITAMSPDPVERWNGLGNDFLKSGNLDEAIACCRQALSINPRSADACASLGVAFFRKGQDREAMDSWQKALSINPNQISVLNNLAWSLATTTDASLRNSTKAIELAGQAKQLTGGEDPTVLRTLAAAYAEEGSFGLATVTARRGLELATEQKNDALAALMQKEIGLYEARMPWRDVKP